MAPDANLGLELIGASGRYLLLDYLGGGQTAGVYRARVLQNQRPERLDHLAAVKLMALDLDAETRKRFLQEVDVLAELQGAETELRRLWGQETSGASAIPMVWDEQRAGPAPFFVMTLAPGEPLDEILRRQRRLPETQALDIARQMAAVFVMLHERLNRSYLDFQPRNLFWQADTAHLTVIDWNLLSPKNQADVAGDLTRLAGLLHRMLFGGEGASQSKAASANGKEWEEISRGTRNILRRALDPRPAFSYNSADEFRQALQQQYDFWQKYGDNLLVDAGTMERQSSQTADLQMARGFLEEAWVLFDMALRRGTSPNQVIQKVREGLQQRLEAQTRAMAPLHTGKMLLDGRDYAKALELFAAALAEAHSPMQRLAARRWSVLGEAARGDYQGYGAVREKLGPVLQGFEEKAWADNNWPLIAQQLGAIPAWDGTRTVCTEIAAYADLQASLAASDDSGAPAADGGLHAGLALLDDRVAEVTARLDRLRAGAEALDRLPTAAEGQSYSNDAWAYVGDGDEAQGRRWAAQADAALLNTQGRLTKLRDRLLAAKSTGTWQALLNEFGPEPLVVRGCLDAGWGLLGQGDDAAGLRLAHAVLERGVTDEALRAEALRIPPLVAAFRRSEALLTALTLLYREQAAAQGRVVELARVKAAESSESAPAGVARVATLAGPAVGGEDGRVARPHQEVEATDTPNFIHEPETAPRTAAAVTGIERRTEAAEATGAVEIETVHLGDAGQLTLALAAALREVFDQIASQVDVSTAPRRRAARLFERLADLSVDTGQGLLSTDALLDSLEETGAIAADAAHAWRQRLAQAQKDQDLSETARRCYAEMEAARQSLADEEKAVRSALTRELATRTKEAEADVARIRAKSRRLIKKRSRLEARARRAEVELASVKQKQEIVIVECEAECQRLLAEAHAAAQVEHDAERQKLDETLEDRRQQLEALAAPIASRIEAEQRELGVARAEVLKAKHELENLTRQRDELRRNMSAPPLPSATEVYLRASAWKLAAQALGMLLHDGAEGRAQASELLRKANEEARKSKSAEVERAIGEWQRSLAMIENRPRDSRETDLFEAWKFMAKSWQDLLAENYPKLHNQRAAKMAEMLDFVRQQGDETSWQQIRDDITVWQAKASERSQDSKPKPAADRTLQVLLEAFRLLMSGGTQEECKQLINRLSTTARDANTRIPQSVKPLMDGLKKALEDWQSKANNLFVQLDGQRGDVGPFDTLKTIVDNMRAAQIMGRQKRGDHLPGIAQKIEERFRSQLALYQHPSQTPGSYRRGQAPEAVIEQLLDFQRELRLQSEEITGGGPDPKIESLLAAMESDWDGCRRRR